MTLTLIELAEKIPLSVREAIAKTLIQENENQKMYNDIVWIPSNGIPNEQVIKDFTLGVSNG